MNLYNIFFKTEKSNKTFEEQWAYEAQHGRIDVARLRSLHGRQVNRDRPVRATSPRK